MRHLSTFVLTGFLAALAACGGSSVPTTPSIAPTVNGTWSGSSADTSGKETVTCTLTQNGSGFTGTMTVNDPNRSMMGNGMMQGTVNGQTVAFHMNVPTGGFSGMMSSCSMMTDWSGTISADGRTMTGTYSGSMSGMMSGGMMNQSQSCGGMMGDGHFTLTR